MANRLDNVETIIIVMMENRSFDHLLGYLSLPPSNRPDIDGFKEGTLYANSYNNQSVSIFELDDTTVLEDPPHDRIVTEMQTGSPPSPGAPFPMDGFIKSYAQRKPAPKEPSLVMGYYTAKSVPVYDFFAKHFALCDRWFCPLPSGTQPNRLMAMAGESRLEDNSNLLIPNQDLLYDWLTKRQVSWCVYNAGLLPFFALMLKWQDNILKDLALPFSLFGKRKFKRFRDFQKDWTSPKAIPQVIFLEPEYSDILDNNPNDDHPPTNIKHGQAFIASIYQTLIANPQRWQKTMMIITYDEHGGCYDHASPLEIATNSPEYTKPFTHTGSRVPAFVVSPLVEAGTVYHEPLDHTSILQLIAERFDPQKKYSDAVSARQQKLGSLSSILNRDTPRSDILQPPTVQEALQKAVKAETLTDNAQATCQAFENSKKLMRQKNPALWPLVKLLQRMP